MPTDFTKTAHTLFETIPYPATETEINDLAKNMKLVADKGLSKLNRRLLESRRNIWDTFSEHNLAVKLISYHDPNVQISYEPDDGLQRPPDFKIVLEGLTFWIQMKRLSNLERDNRQFKIVQRIRTEALKIKSRMFFGCDLAENFSEKDIIGFIEFLSQTSKNPGENYYFPNSEKPKAIITFWYPNKINIDSLTLGISNDMNIVEETGLGKNQIRQSIIKAASAFEWVIDKDTINFVAMDANKYDDIDLCDAVFGTEFELFGNGRHSWGREKDGFFLLPDYSNKVAGVIALKSDEPTPICNYYAMLYVNDIFKDRINDFCKLLSFSKVIHFNQRPSMGQGNFEISN